MDKGKDLTTIWKIENNKDVEWENVHFGDIKGALPWSLNTKEGCWKYNLWTRSKGKGFKNLLLWDEHKLKQVITK